MSMQGHKLLLYVAICHKENLWDFADALREYGFIDAIYITGGTDYCFYRDKDGIRHDIGDSADYPHTKWKGIIPKLTNFKLLSPSAARSGTSRSGNIHSDGHTKTRKCLVQ